MSLVLFFGILLAFCESALACLKTRFKEGEHLLSAAIVNPASPVTSYVNGGDCDIAIYYEGGGEGQINGAWIYGGTKYGIVVNGDGGESRVDLINTTIQNIGIGPGTGVGIYYRAYSPKGRATGTVRQSVIEGYWSAGVVANGPGTQVTIKENVIGSYHPTEEGLIGVQIGFGARGIVADNEIFHNSSYWINTATAYPGIGVLVVGGSAFGACPYGDLCAYTSGIIVEGNQLLQNDVGILFFNSSENFTAPIRSMRGKITHNYLWDEECTNELYQVAIGDLGKQDEIAGKSNTIEGRGYAACRTYYNPTSLMVDRDPTFVPGHAIK